MPNILMYVNALSCTQLVICFGVVSLLLAIFINNVWISLCYFGALPAGLYLANQICSRLEFLDVSAFLLNIRYIHESYKTVSNIGKLNAELSNVSRSPIKTATFSEQDQTLNHTPAEELSICLDFIIRDFFKSWYCNISTETKCYADAHQYLESVFNNLFDKLRKIDTVQVVRELTVIYTHHLQDIHKAKIYVCEEKKQANCSAVMSQELHKLFRLVNQFHPALESNEKELNYLRAFVQVLGHSMLPVDMYRCSSARCILLDILTKNVMLPLVDKLSNPHWLHETLIKILSDGGDRIANATNTQQQASSDVISQLNVTEDAQNLQLDQVTFDVDVSQLRDVYIGRSHADCLGQLTTLKSADAESQTKQGKAIHDLGAISPREDGAGSEAAETETKIMASLPGKENLDQSTSQNSELEEQQMFVAHDLGRYLHVLSNAQELQQDQDNLKQIAAENLSQLPLQPKFTEVERQGAFPGHCVSPRSRSHSFSSLEGVSSGSDVSLSMTGRKATFFLGQDDFSSQSDSGSRQSLNMERTSSRLMPLGCSFRQKWISSENIHRVNGEDVAARGTSSWVTRRRSRSVTYLPASTAEDQHQASADDAKQSSQDWTALVQGETPAQVCTGEKPRLLFTSVTITDTVTAQEPGSTGQYTLYVIEYTAWHESEDDHWVQHQFIVRRRHKEFVALQHRLGVYPSYKTELKGVKGPLRWMSLPFANMDRNSIESRRKFLQSYLQSLITKSQISNSDVMKEFFAYERDASIAFVKRAPKIPRIDKAITRTMSGMFNKISKIVPGTREVEPPSGRHAPQWLRRDTVNKPIEQEDWTDSLDVAFDVTRTAPDDEETLDKILARCSHDNVALVDDGQSHDSNDAAMIGRPRRSEGDGCDASQLQDKDDTPLTTVVVDLLTQLLTGRESWVKRTTAIRFFKNVFGHPLNKFLETELASLTTSVKCAHYVQLLRESVWPDGQLTWSETVPSDTQKEMTRQQARQCVYNYLPVLVPLIMGEDTYNYVVDAFMDSLDSAMLNRHLFYCLLDQILESVVPEVSSVEFQQELIEGRCPKDTAGY